jgi:hypothetical protein
MRLCSSRPGHPTTNLCEQDGASSRHGPRLTSSPRPCGWRHSTLYAGLAPSAPHRQSFPTRRPPGSTQKGRTARRSAMESSSPAAHLQAALRTVSASKSLAAGPSSLRPEMLHPPPVSTLGQARVAPAARPDSRSPGSCQAAPRRPSVPAARLPTVPASRRPPPRRRQQRMTRPLARPALLVTRRQRWLAPDVLVQPRPQGLLVERRATARLATRSTSASHPKTRPDSALAGEQRWRSCRRPAQTAPY